MQDYSKITQLTTVVIERTSFLEFLSGCKFLWEFLWQVLQAASVKGEETSLHCIGVVEFTEYILQYHSKGQNQQTCWKFRRSFESQFLIVSVTSDIPYRTNAMYGQTSQELDLKQFKAVSQVLVMFESEIGDCMKEWRVSVVSL